LLASKHAWGEACIELLTSRLDNINFDNANLAFNPMGTFLVLRGKVLILSTATLHRLFPVGFFVGAVCRKEACGNRFGRGAFIVEICG